MPRKNSKKSLKKNKSVNKNTNSLEFNVNLENNPNGLVSPVVNAVSDEAKLGKLLNGMTQNSFNDGVDTTIHNTAMLLNTQLEKTLGDNPGMFNQKTLEKMLHYLIEPTFNQLNEMANNTNYNYNQFGGVVGQKQFNNNLKRGEQKGGFYANMPRFRRPMFMPRMRQTIIPRVGYHPRLVMPRTMIVPSYSIITHDRVRDLMDRRERDKFNTYLSHNHSFEDNDVANGKKIKIRDHPDIGNHTELTALTRLGDNFYKISTAGKTDVIVNGFNLYYDDNRYKKDMYYNSYKLTHLSRIENRALHKSKNNADKLKYISNTKLNLGGHETKLCSESSGCNPINSVKNGYFAGPNGESDRHVMMLENVIN